MNIGNVFIKDPASAITHFIGACLAAVAAFPLMYRSLVYGSSTTAAAAFVFIISMVVLYSASSIYHTFDLDKKRNVILRKIDHMSIYLLIAGTYTPICLVVLKNATGHKLLSIVWGLAVIGMIFNACWITCPKWLSSSIYIAMGWLCVLTFSQLLNSLPFAAFMWLLIGGIIYTVGGVIYALKLQIFNTKHKVFDSHAVFHLFVMGGSICHFVMIYKYVVLY